MKVTNLGLVKILNQLDKYSEKKLPQKISYAIAKNLMILQKELDCYNVSLEKLFNSYDEYIVKDDTGNRMFKDNGIPIIEPEYEKEFNDELVNLLNIELDVEMYHIPEDVFDFNDVKGIYDPLSVLEIMELESILCGNGDRRSC